MKKAPELLQHLQRKHQSLDRELGELLNQAHLTPEEHRQVTELKKRKLITKDGITALQQVLTGA